MRAATLEMPDVGEAIARKRRELAGSARRGERGEARAGASGSTARSSTWRARATSTRWSSSGTGRSEGGSRRSRARASVDARFVGRVPREEALAWIGAAEIVLFASEEEGASTVLREARDAGNAGGRRDS